MAKKVRVTQAYIAMLEKVGDPTLDVLRRLSRALEITLTELLK